MTKTELDAISKEIGSPDFEKRLDREKAALLKSGFNAIAASENLLDKLKEFKGKEVTKIDIAVYAMGTFTEVRMASEGTFEQTGIYQEYASIYGDSAARELYNRYKAAVDKHMSKVRKQIAAGADPHKLFKEDCKKKSESSKLLDEFRNGIIREAERRGYLKVM